MSEGSWPNTIHEKAGVDQRLHGTRLLGLSRSLISVLILEWLLVIYFRMGVHKRRWRLRDLVGGRRATLKHVKDIVVFSTQNLFQKRRSFLSGEIRWRCRPLTISPTVLLLRYFWAADSPIASHPVYLAISI